MKRDGVAYPVEPNTILRRGDVLVTSPRATACIQIGGSFLALNEKSELRVETPAQTGGGPDPCYGRGVLSGGAEHPIALTLGEGQPLALREATAFASVRWRPGASACTPGRWSGARQRQEPVKC